MKKFFLIQLGLLLFAFSYCKEEVTIQKENIEKFIAKPQFIKGDVKLERQGNIQNLEMNTMLLKDDKILTGKDAALDIILKDRGIIRIGEESVIEIKSLLEENLEFNQSSGTIITHLKRLSSSEKFSVVTPTSVASVRGTSFIVKVDKQTNNTNIALVEGSLEIKDNKGKSVILDEPGEISISKDMEIRKENLKPLSKESLKLLKDLASADKGNVQEFSSFIQELKNSKVYKEIQTESNFERKIEETKLVQTQKNIEKIKSSEEETIKRNTAKDPLKIPTDKEFK